MSHFSASDDASEWDTKQMATQVILWQPLDVDNALQELGLDRDGLTRAVRYAEHEKSFVTANDPIGFNSYIVYAKAGRALREWYLPKGWVKDDSNNQSAIKNPKTKVRVTPCNFNEFAGDRFVKTTNKSPKGEVSRTKSACNRTAWLPGLEPPIIDPELNDGYQTWVLGIYTDEVRPTGAELSWPVGFDGRYFTQFGKRLILLSSDDGEGIGKRKGSNDDAVGVVDIEIKRK
jgi:hypothetical protein